MSIKALALIFSHTSVRETEKTTIAASGISLPNRYAMEIKPAELMRIREATMTKDTRAVGRTKSGAIEGVYEDPQYAFKGIPYATPPVGKLQ